VSTLITIDLDALTENFRWYGEQARPATCAAVVKADAYGLGVARIAQTLHRAGCSQFFAATHREGMQLRALLPDAAVYVFEGVTTETADLFVEHNLVPVLIAEDQGAAWAQRARQAGRPLPAIIDIDTGMARLGFGERELQALRAQGDDLDWLRIEYVMTHLACADERGSPSVGRQLELFMRLRGLLPPAPTSIGNSAGSLLGPEAAGDMIRIGLSLFGGNPYLDGEHPARPVVRVQSRILQLRDITEPTPVGYGATFTAEAGSRIATVGTGYADGYPWSLANRGVAVVGGHRVPVVGRISMDLITLDVSGLPDELVQPGCEVDLVGPGISLEEVAERAGTINYEILTRLSQRARRRYIGGAAAD